VARNNAVGLDIGTRTVNVAQVSTKGGRPSVTDFGRFELPPEAVREGEVLDPKAVGDAIRQLYAATSIKDKNVLVGVANQRVVVRQVDLPYLPESELRTSLRFQVQEFIPIPVEDAELDFHVLEEFEGDSGTRMQRLLLVAAHKDMVQTHLEAVAAAGLRPVGVDLNPFALLRALVGDSPMGSGSEVLIDVGAGVTNIVVHDNGVPRFVRILVLGGEDITGALVRDLNLSREAAEAAKQSISLGGGAGDPNVSRVIEERAGQFIDEIRSSLDYYQAQTGSNRLSRLVLTGGGALLGGLTERLAQAVRLPVELGRPFDLTPASGTKLSDDQLAAVGPLLTTAIGLATGGAQ
jgi:type IV pilus assembly protein PilM